MRIIVATLLMVAAAPAMAQDAPPLCSDRPGKATPTCVVAAGTLQLETSLTDWSHSSYNGSRDDTLLFGDSLVKYGIGSGTELRVSFTPYIHDRVRDGSAVSVADGFGDIGLSFRSQILPGNADGLALSIEPYVIVPAGSHQVSAGTWSAGVVVPVSLPLPGGWSLAASPSVAASADSDRHGRHLFYSGVVAVGHGLGSNVSGTVELYAAHDRDPSGHTTPVTADFLLAWQPSTNLQFDVSSYVGLNRDAADVELLGGFTRRFR